MNLVLQDFVFFYICLWLPVPTRPPTVPNAAMAPPVFPQSFVLSKNFRWVDLRSMLLPRTFVRVCAAGDVCAQTMRDIAHSTTAHRLSAFHAQVDITAEDTSSVPAWDDFRDFVTNCSSCESLVLQGFGFRPVAASLALSQMHGIFALLASNPASLQQAVIEIPVIDDHCDSGSISDFVAGMNSELARDLAPARWAHLWYEYRAYRNGVLLIHFSLEIRKQSVTLKRLLRSNLRFPTPLKGVDATPVLVANGNDCATISLSGSTSVKFHSWLFPEHEVHYQCNRLIAQITAATWAPRVAALSFHIDNPATLAFDDSPRAAKKRSTVRLWWQDITDALAVCTFCSSLVVTGDISATVGVHGVQLKLRELLESKPAACKLHSVFIEIRAPCDVDDVDHDTWRHATGDGLAWEQGATRCPGGRVLLWACKMQRVGPRGARKRGPLETLGLTASLTKLQKLSLVCGNR